jgi:hypothetical protein
MEKSEVARLSPEETRRRVDSGKALLICGYESDEKCQSMHLQGAETLSQFRARLPDIPKEQEVIFYCA